MTAKLKPVRAIAHEFCNIVDGENAEQFEEEAASILRALHGAGFIIAPAPPARDRRIAAAERKALKAGVDYRNGKCGWAELSDAVDALTLERAKGSKK